MAGDPFNPSLSAGGGHFASVEAPAETVARRDRTAGLARQHNVDTQVATSQFCAANQTARIGLGEDPERVRLNTDQANAGCRDVDRVAEAGRLLSESTCISASDVTSVQCRLQDLDLDSMDLVELILQIECEFNLELPENIITRIETVADVTTLLASITAAKSQA